MAENATVIVWRTEKGTILRISRPAGTRRPQFVAPPALHEGAAHAHSPHSPIGITAPVAPVDGSFGRARLPTTDGVRDWTG